MAMRCEKVRELLNSYYDRELHGRKFDAVSEHLHQCQGCSSEFRKLERMGQMIKAHYEGVAASEDLSDVWKRVDAAIGKEPAVHEPEPLRDRLTRIFLIPKPAWAAAGVVAIALVFALSYLPGNHMPTVAANECIIDSVEAEDYSVMVYEVGDTNMKVIWVMEEATGETEEKAGVAS